VGFRLSAAVREDVMTFYRQQLWSAASILASRPYPGVLGVIRWFQIQPGTRVALNTGRPETVRCETLESLNAIGLAFRVSFDPDLLFMNPKGWGEEVRGAKMETLRRLRERGLRITAVVDNEPENLRAMMEIDEDREILFLHADTIFESQRVPMPQTISGTSYGLAGLASEIDLRGRVQFVWHGVNDEANLRQFLSSGITWAECDVRLDPIDRLVLRHDSFEEVTWHRLERPFLLEECLAMLSARGRSAKLDLKEDGAALERMLEVLERAGFDDEQLWFNAEIQVLGHQGFRRITELHPRSTVSCPVDFAAPLLLTAPELVEDILEQLASWGVTRLSLGWTTPGVRELLDVLERWGWNVNLYGVPDLETFLEAALLLPASVTADFNFPDWHYFGRGSGHGGHHRYELVTT
jgi:hypothetical protein